MFDIWSDKFEFYFYLHIFLLQGELSMGVPGGGQVHIDTGRSQTGGDEVEVMSTDSSSSSSTDSN